MRSSIYDPNQDVVESAKAPKWQTTRLPNVRLPSCKSAKCPSGLKKKRKMVEKIGGI